jgi:osmotically-inducible protein OsmY
MKLIGLVAAVVAAVVYFLDAERRRRTVERAKGLVGQQPSAMTDETLKAKIESEVFRDTEAPKGDVNVNVEQGVVYLRGQLDDQSLIDDLRQRVESVSGVERVESLLETRTQSG